MASIIGYTKTKIDSLLSVKVATSRQVAGHPLTADVTISKGDVGLGNVDNTADIDKPVSTAQGTAISSAASEAAASVTKASLGLGSVDNTADTAKPVSTAQASAISSAVAGVTKTSLGLGNVNNTSDTAKPISTATAAAIAAIMPVYVLAVSDPDPTSGSAAGLYVKRLS